MGEIRICQVDPAKERERILAVLADNLPDAAVPERFDWIYLTNPDGAALVWLAEQDDGKAVGTSAAYPRRMRVGGDLVRALNLGDFAIDRSQRTLGVALRLLGATLAPVRDGTYALSYDFASASMHAVYRRMRVPALGRSERWMQPVAMRPLLRRKLGDGPLTAVAAAAGDAFWHARRSLHGRPSGVRLDSVTSECTAEFDALDARLARERPVVGVRDARYLTWRYLRNPVCKHEIICARADGRLLGYAVLRRVGPDIVSILDLQAEQTPVSRLLLSAAVRSAAAQGAAAIQVEVLAASPTARLVKALGFVRRESSDGPVAFFRSDAADAATLEQAANWWLMGGDRDV